MNRRRFLGFISTGAIPLAGCTGSNEGQVQTTTVTTTDASKPPKTTTKDPTDTPETTETTEEPSTTETETTAPEDVAAEHIQSTTALLEEAITTYAYFEGEQNASILNVTATSESFDRHQIDAKVVDARNELSTAESNAVEGQEETISKLRELTKFLSQIAFAQAKLAGGYQSAQEAEDALHEAQFGDVWSEGGQTKNAGAGARTYLDAAVAESSAESCSVVGNLSESTYTKKVDQIKAEASAIQTIGQQLRRLRDGMREYDRATTEYRKPAYKYSKQYFNNANNLFTKITESIATQDHKSPVGSLYSDIDCFAGAMAGTTEHLKKASDAGLDNDTETLDEEDKKATEAFLSCEVVREILGEIY